MITIKDIAARAGVSLTTVSVSLNDRRAGVCVPEETRRHVKAVAREMGYVRNRVALSMLRGRTNVLGFMHGAFVSDYDTQTLIGAAEAAQKRGYFVKIFPYYYREFLQDAVDALFEQRPAGIICRNVIRPLFDAARENGAPLAIVSRVCDQCAVSVDKDDFRGGRLAAERLVGLGHRDVAFLGYDESEDYSRKRLGGFCRVLEEHGLPVRPEWVVHREKLPEIEVAAEQLLRAAERPTAAFCATDEIAMTLLRVAWRIGLHLPRDFSVIGFSNMAMCRHSAPPLTTIDEPSREMGAFAAGALIDLVENKITGPVEKIFDVKLLERESTALPPSAPEKTT